MISGTWWAWEEVVGHQTQPNCIWRFICSNISSNVIVGKYKIPKKNSTEEVTEAREVAIPQSLSHAIWSASLFWEIDEMTYYCPVIIENITHMYKKYVQFFQDINRYAQTHFQWRSQCTWLLVLGRQQFLQRRWWNTRVSRLVEEPVTELLSSSYFHCVAHLRIALDIKIFQHVQKTCNMFLFKC